MKPRKRSTLAPFAAIVCLSAMPYCIAHPLTGGTPAPVPSRCWYVVQETVVPVNLVTVSVTVTGTGDPGLRKVIFRDAARQNRLVTQVETTPNRAAELIDAIQRRRRECTEGSR